MCFNAVRIEANFYGLNSEVSKQNSWLHFEQSSDLERKRTCPRLWGFPLTAEEEELEIEIVTTRCSDGAPATMEEHVYPFSFLRSFMDSLLILADIKNIFLRSLFILSTPKFVFQGKNSQIDQDEWSKSISPLDV